METVRLVVLEPSSMGKIVELAPVNVNSLKEAQRFWEEAGEGRNIVQEYLEIEVSDETYDFLEQSRESHIEELEVLLTAFYNKVVPKNDRLHIGAAS